MNYKETAAMLASCGLTLDTFESVAKVLIYDHHTACPVSKAETRWQAGFADCLNQLAHEATQISAAWPN